jgi:hypothetical protein
VLPLNSVRRSLETSLENIVGNRRWRKLQPDLDQRVKPAKDWSIGARKRALKKARHTIRPDDAARRMVGSWQLSSFQDYALRSLLQWLKDRHVPVVLHQLPVHAKVAQLVQQDPRLAQSYRDYCDYTDSLKPAPRAIFRSLDPADFGGDATSMVDRTHLNEAGALLYSARLADKIRPYMRRTTPPRGRATAGK